MNPSNQNAAGSANMRILSLVEGRTLLALYETMTEAANARDWNRLLEIEQQAAAICDASRAHPSSIAAEDVEELTVLLTRIQRLGHEIRHQVEPAREQARQQLTVEVKGRAVREAYGGMENSKS